MIAPLWRRMTGLDRLITALLLAAVAASFALLGQREAGERVLVERDGRLLFSAPLDEARRVSLPGPLGDTLLEIADGQARILASPCAHKVCVGMGGVFRRGALIACVPNRLIVHIEGQGEEGAPAYDLLSH
ncbi:NusG domain II-containing protein [Geoalkalibacter halelectricus]|uniref:NusG domain II-containing protein n=1 Tax=Geoalkalibacter halelectricus TaxID=2847045 RepID=A0ABY5ZMI7_9BACT|nr:NusG domain II-containing protein [Geoalkalibacter halelectricus]MDO3378397.1 NusG domain II-containing protein [Geoalkalibacter halelectricus]UWZ80283.1 NusG domain II-containing protein [Geoalkalibacter halelectricus]